MSTSAVVVTWEGGDATRRCVASLLALERPPATIVVVDNASGAAERDALRRAWPNEPRVHVLFLDENRQFAGGMNAGAQWALARGATKLLFLNNIVQIYAQPFTLTERLRNRRIQIIDDNTYIG